MRPVTGCARHYGMRPVTGCTESMLRAEHPTLEKLILDVISLDSPTDYRLDRIKGLPVYLTPDDAAATAALDEAWARLTDDDPGRPLDLDVMGRKVTLPRYAHNVARASFADLCAAALGPGDYLAIAESVHAADPQDAEAGHVLRRPSRRSRRPSARWRSVRAG